jgi:hypothetical protein
MSSTSSTPSCDPGCQNSGVCSLSGPSNETIAACNCLSGSTGDDCSITICTRLAPCTNGGQCLWTGGDTYSCNCPTWYTGTNCTVNIADSVVSTIVNQLKTTIGSYALPLGVIGMILLVVLIVIVVRRRSARLVNQSGDQLFLETMDIATALGGHAATTPAQIAAVRRSVATTGTANSDNAVAAANGDVNANADAANVPDDADGDGGGDGVDDRGVELATGTADLASVVVVDSSLGTGNSLPSGLTANKSISTIVVPVPSSGRRPTRNAQTTASMARASATTASPAPAAPSSARRSRRL